MSDCTRPARLSLRILTATSVALARVARTLMPGYFFSNAAVTGRTSWLMIWVEYQLTSPSFLAASTRAASAACATLVANTLVAKEAASARAMVEIRRAMGISLSYVSYEWAAGGIAAAGILFINRSGGPPSALRWAHATRRTGAGCGRPPRDPTLSTGSPTILQVFDAGSLHGPLLTSCSRSWDFSLEQG